MDDQNGNVIDGTERARQWRRPRPKSPATAESTETRADAPKSIAGSLLVPAEMLSAALPPDEHLNGNEQGRAAAPLPRANAGAGERASPEARVHQNPFLVPEAGGVEHHSRFTRRRIIAALLASPWGLISARRGSSRPLRRLAAMPGWVAALRLPRLLALAALTSAVAVTAVIATRPNAASHPSLAPALGATGPVLALRKGPLIVASNPFAQQAAARDRASHRARRVRAHRTVGTHRRRRPARKPAVLLARYTPPTSDSGISAPSSATSSYAVSTPTAAPSQAAPSSGGGTTSSSSSGSSRPAFGENGTLGPGRGAPGTQ